MVAVPEAEGVHWKTSSGEVPELPQLPACVLVPLVVPPKVPPWAGIWVGLPQAPPASVVFRSEDQLGRGARAPAAAGLRARAARRAAEGSPLGRDLGRVATGPSRERGR